MALYPLIYIARQRQFGASAVQPEAFPDARIFHEDDPRKKMLDEICDRFLSWNGGQLVSATHAEDGAWIKHYQPGEYSIRIPDVDIKGEYDARAEAGRKAREKQESAER